MTQDDLKLLCFDRVVSLLLKVGFRPLRAYTAYSVKFIEFSNSLFQICKL